MGKTVWSTGALFASCILALAPFPADALTEPCGQSSLTASGYFFTSYESTEYSPDGLFIYHFKNNPTYSDGRTFGIKWVFVDDECHDAGIQGGFQPISLPAGVSQWSIRLASPTSLEVWDDQHGVVVESITVPEYPSYTRIKFNGNIDGGASGFISRTVRMHAQGEPPIIDNTLDKPAPCPAIAASGYYFDPYEHAEYTDGLLRVHLRLRSPYNDGRPFKAAAFTPGATCLIEPPFIFSPGTQLPPYMRYYSFRMISQTEWQLWDDEHEQPLVCTQCSGTIAAGAPFVSFYGSIDGGASSLRTTPFPPTLIVEPEVPDPVIIIPGILGSEQHNGEWVIDPILHSYDDLIATLDANGYTPDVDLFPFPYNWRKSNVDTAILLKQKIDAVKEICNCQKVDLVAHSMGGLVARQYIQSDAYQQDVDQLIFLGTPHLGAPKAYLMWEGGELSPINDFFDQLTEILLSHEAYEKHYPSLFAYLRTESIDSIKELLPTYNYIFDANILRQYPQNYPANPFLEDLNSNVNKLLTSGVKISNIVGETNTQETINAIQATDPTTYLPLWADGFPAGFYDLLGSHGLIRGSGDLTVPVASASFVNVNLTATSSIHSALPSEAEGGVFKILTGHDASILLHDHDGLNVKLVLIKILSPADLLVVAPDGKKIGKENGQEVNQIPNAFYTGFTTDTEFITILNPLDGEYKIFSEGTGSGAYTVETNYISDATSTEASFIGDTLPGLITELNVPIDNENPTALEIQPADITPPDITMQSPVARDYLHSEQLPINVSATDSESGVHELVSLLDSTSTPNVGSIDLFFQSLGTHSVFALSADNVGNEATSTRAFRVIADATSTLSDIDRAYALQWMTKKVHDALVKKLKSCTVKKTTITTVTKTIVVTGKNGKPTTKKIYEKTEKVEIVFDKNCAKAMLKELGNYRNKGLNEQAYLLLKEDINWLINN